VRRELHGKQSVLKLRWFAVEVPALFAAQVEGFVGSPDGAGASGKIEFDAVFEGVEPEVERKGLQAHGMNSGQIDAQVKTRQIRVWLDSSLGMRLAG
jgi:hypothetical protein